MPDFSSDYTIPHGRPAQRATQPHGAMPPVLSGARSSATFGRVIERGVFPYAAAIPGSFRGAATPAGSLNSRLAAMTAMNFIGADGCKTSVSCRP